MTDPQSLLEIPPVQRRYLFVIGFQPKSESLRLTGSSVPPQKRNSLLGRPMIIKYRMECSVHSMVTGKPFFRHIHKVLLLLHFIVTTIVRKLSVEILVFCFAKMENSSLID
jgi:hypothetical protein